MVAAATTNNGMSDDLGWDLDIKKVEARTTGVGGTWVDGTVAGHRFQALIFAGHAANPEHQVNGDSRISKLWLQRLAGKHVVYSWDRGLDVPPADSMAAAIVDFVCEGLADFIFGR